jgi:hypothetical protein
MMSRIAEGIAKLVGDPPRMVTLATSRESFGTVFLISFLHLPKFPPAVVHASIGLSTTKEEVIRK